MTEALNYPAEVIRRHCETERVPLHGLPEVSRLSLARGPGHRTLLSMIRQGSATWWRLMTPHEVREWSEGHGMLDVHAVIADRLLREFGGKATGPMQLPNTPERTQLRAWVHANLGDPILRKNRWAEVSAEAQRIYQWMVVAEAIGKILEEFQKRSDQDRFAYWSRKVDQMDDALYYDADVAVCMMVIGSALVIEFGRTGNACYFYGLPDDMTSLASLNLPDKMGASEFKQRGLLVLGGKQLSFIKKLSHHRGWQGDFDEFMGLAVPSRLTR